MNSSLLDGFDVAFTKLLFTEFLGADVNFYPYPDVSSLCVLNRRLASSLDGRRERCSASAVHLHALTRAVAAAAQLRGPAQR